MPKKKLILISAVVLLVLAVIAVALKPSLTKKDVYQRQLAVQRAYSQWAIKVTDGDPSACDLMTDEAVDAYLNSVLLPKNVIEQGGCSAVIPILAEELDMREPLEPYKLLKKFNDAIYRFRFEDNNKALLWTKDFASGQRPVVLVYQDDHWLIDAESFKQ